jgi:hypothetical protein
VYFARIASREFSDQELSEIERVVLGAYRWQYIITGVQHPHFGKLLTSMTTPARCSASGGAWRCSVGKHDGVTHDNPSGHCSALPPGRSHSDGDGGRVPLGTSLFARAAIASFQLTRSKARAGTSAARARMRTASRTCPCSGRSSM